jgi:hypothetical protein
VPSAGGGGCAGALHVKVAAVAAARPRHPQTRCRGRAMQLHVVLLRSTVAQDIQRYCIHMSKFKCNLAPWCRGAAARPGLQVGLHGSPGNATLLGRPRVRLGVRTAACRHVARAGRPVTALPAAHREGGLPLNTAAPPGRRWSQPHWRQPAAAVESFPATLLMWDRDTLSSPPSESSRVTRRLGQQPGRGSHHSNQRDPLGASTVGPWAVRPGQPHRARAHEDPRPLGGEVRQWPGARAGGGNAQSSVGCHGPGPGVVPPVDSEARRRARPRTPRVLSESEGRARLTAAAVSSLTRIAGDGPAGAPSHPAGPERVRRRRRRSGTPISGGASA